MPAAKERRGIAAILVLVILGAAYGGWSWHKRAAALGELRYPILIDGKVGYLDGNGRLAVPARYEAHLEGDYSEGLAAVQIDNKWGFIDRSGTQVIAPDYYEVESFSEGLASVRPVEFGLAGYMDPSGKVVIAPAFSNAGSFSSGLAAVQIDYKKYGYIDKTGKLVIEARYDTALPHNEGLAAVQVGDNWGYIDQTGKMVVAPGYAMADSFHEGLAAVGNSDNKVGYIDGTGKVVIPLQFEGADRFVQGLARIKVGGKVGFIDKTGQVVIQPSYDTAGRFSEGLAVVTLNSSSGYIDRSGKLVIPMQFPVAEAFQDGRAMVGIDVRHHVFGYIDISGAFVYKPAPVAEAPPEPLPQLSGPVEGVITVDKVDHKPADAVCVWDAAAGQLSVYFFESTRTPQQIVEIVAADGPVSLHQDKLAYAEVMFDQGKTPTLDTATTYSFSANGVSDAGSATDVFTSCAVGDDARFHFKNKTGQVQWDVKVSSPVHKATAPSSP